MSREDGLKCEETPLGEIELCGRENAVRRGGEVGDCACSHPLSERVDVLFLFPFGLSEWEESLHFLGVEVGETS